MERIYLFNIKKYVVILLILFGVGILLFGVVGFLLFLNNAPSTDGGFTIKEIVYLLILFQSALFLYLGFKYLKLRNFYVQADNSTVSYCWIGNNEETKVDIKNIKDIAVGMYSIKLHLQNGKIIDLNLENIEYVKVKGIKNLFSKIKDTLKKE